MKKNNNKNKTLGILASMLFFVVSLIIISELNKNAESKQKKTNYTKASSKKKATRASNKSYAEVKPILDNNAVKSYKDASEYNLMGKGTISIALETENHKIIIYDVEGPKKINQADPVAEITNAIDLTKSPDRILINAFSLTCPDTIAAVERALKRGVHVIVILDYGQGSQKYSSYYDQNGQPGLKTLQIQYNNLEVYIHQKQGCAHKKIIIINDDIMFWGSYNFTKGAYLRNVECLYKVTVKNKNSEYHKIIDFFTERFFSTINSIKNDQPKLLNKIDRKF